MRKPILVLMAASLVLAGCGGWGSSRANPRNWFGNSREVADQIPTDGEAVNPLIPKKSAIGKRPQKADTSVEITTVTELQVDRTPTGAIIYATGITARQGAYNVALVPNLPTQDSKTTTLSLSFRVTYPNDPTPIGSDHSRKVTAAYTLSNHDLANVNLIRVEGETNVRETRRR